MSSQLFLQPCVLPFLSYGIEMSPTNKRDKERLRQLQLRREEEQDRTIRVIKAVNTMMTKTSELSFRYQGMNKLIVLVHFAAFE